MSSESNRLPSHVAIVMDGNGRWAKKRMLPRTMGHHAGVKATRNIVEYCVNNHIGCLTLFAFSSENWKRSDEEVGSLMSLFVSALSQEINELDSEDVRIRFIGDKSRFPSKLRDCIDDAESRTAANTGLRLNIAANYGGRWDIVNAARKLIDRVRDEALDVTDIDESLFGESLALADQPEPDLFIRSGGERRISNFLMWQLAYTELYFTDLLWPDFTTSAFEEALRWFAGRQRRFGTAGAV